MCQQEIRELSKQLKAEKAARKELENELERSQAITNIGTWTWSVDENRLLSCSKQYADIYGVSMAEAYALRDNKVVHPDDLELVERVFKESEQLEDVVESYKVDYRIRRSDGETRYIRELGYKALKEGGKPLVQFGTIQDITEIKLTEQRLQRTVDSFNESQAIANIGSWRWSIPEDRLLACSDQYAYIHGVSTDEIYDLLDEQMEKIIYPEDRAYVEKKFAEADQQGVKEYQLDYRIVRADGEVRHVREIGTRVVDKTGLPLEQFGTLQDITEIKQFEINLEVALEDLRHASQAKDRFLSCMSHELRTPLNAILGFAQIIMMDHTQDTPEIERTGIAEIMTAGNHLLSLVTDVLDLVRMEEQQLPLSFEECDIDEIIKGCITSVANKSSRIAINYSNNGIKVKANQFRLNQVLLQLLGNAIKFSDSDGVIDVDVKELERDIIEMRIRDHGMGIPNKDKHDLFNAFSRSSLSDKYAIGGIGVGLTLAKYLVDLMNGEIGFDSVEGEGATFWVRLSHWR